MLVLTSVKVIENKVEDEVNVTLEVEVTIEKVDVTKEDNSMIRKILVFLRKFWLALLMPSTSLVTSTLYLSSMVRSPSYNYLSTKSNQ